MDFQTILVSKEDHIAKVTLNRPEKLNAVNDQMVTELIEAFSNIAEDEEARVLMLTGAGRGFCAGADIEGSSIFNERDAERIRQRLKSEHQMAIQALRGIKVPTIAVVNGIASGMGFDIALACDIRIGSENARFMVAFTRIGLVSGDGGAWLMPRVMGLPKAAELTFTGDFLEAKEAEKIGVLNRLVPADKLEEEAMALAQRIAERPPIAIRLSKLQLYEGLLTDFQTSLDVAAANQAIAFLSQDHKEGIAAFREKRRPLFKGK
jgi:2-(1,2-epoxy-1,2-dihydrophenyl)acetyl-CoA isomerase